MNLSMIKTYAVIVAITILGLFVVHDLDISYPVRISSSGVHDLSVTGEGQVDVVPDTANIRIGIAVENQPNAETAQNEIARINNSILAALSELGVDEEDIQTSQYSVNPSYSFDERREISGYSGQATVTVETQNTDLVPEIVTAATDAGANQINGVNYTVDDPSAFREAARSKAIEDAKQQAQKIADELGIELGNVVNFMEHTPARGPIPYGAGGALELRTQDTAVQPEFEPGTETVSSTVTLYFERK